MPSIIFHHWDDKKPRRIPRPISRCYIGYGYVLIHFDDGSRELRYEPFSTSRLPLGRIPKFTDDGYPILE